MPWGLEEKKGLEKKIWGERAVRGKQSCTGSAYRTATRLVGHSPGQISSLNSEDRQGGQTVVVCGWTWGIGSSTNILHFYVWVCYFLHEVRSMSNLLGLHNIFSQSIPLF
jgi:hypothetical protein